MSTLLILVVILAGQLLFVAFFMSLGARWTKAPNSSFLRSLRVTLFIVVLNLVLAWVLEKIGPEGPPVLTVLIVFICGQILLSWLVIRSSFRTTLPRAIAVWAVSLIGVLVAVALVFSLIRLYVLEAFVIPTNAMAPTVIGWHQTGTCPECQGLLIVPARPPEDSFRPIFDHDQLAICASCRETSAVQATRSPVEAPDRIAVNKLLGPRRWDMLVFRSPFEPEKKYMMRLVGLPGETVYLRDGAVWINEVRTEPPADLAGLRYTAEVEGANLGTPDNPWRLEHDQYCVLGDFSLRSFDSRYWGSVPASHIEGVVGLCYWPVFRWRVFH